MTAKRVTTQEEKEKELRRGPWTIDEDTLLIHYIACHGEGRWNLLAKCSGLRRTGKSCRLRWLNYLKPDVKRGNLTPEEQILILELHSKWGNRWSRIAQHLPGRTDNEIKNYWRTRVQKQAKQLKIDANSALFREVVRRIWMPRLLQSLESSQPIVPLPFTQPDLPIIVPDQQVVAPVFLRSPAPLDGLVPCYYGTVQPPLNYGGHLATAGGCEQLRSYGMGDAGGEVPAALTVEDIGWSDLEAPECSMIPGGAVQSPWDSTDELWQVMTATCMDMIAEIGV